MSLRKGLIFFILLVFGSSAVILFKSVDKETISSLINADKRFFLLAFGLILVAWVCDTGRFCALAKAAGEKVSFKMGMILTWLHYFGCAVTPMQSGGGPFQVYLLYKKGVPIGKGIAITTLRTMLTVLILTLVVPFALHVNPTLLDGSPFIKGLVRYVFVVILCTWAFIVFTVISPRIFKRLGKSIAVRLRSVKWLSLSKVKKTCRWLDREMDNYSNDFKMTVSRRGAPYTLLAVALSVAHLLCIFSVLPMLMLAVGLPFNYSQTLVVQAVFTFVLYFIPTPGASGVAEGGGAFLFGMLMPPNMAGVMAIIWRFFTEYISIFMGVAVVIKMLGWGVMEDVSHEDAAIVVAAEEKAANPYPPLS
ncbi:membrane protein [Synergistales bacterium]|nr:membrane protein [Synergistales bacterium]